MVGVNSIAYSNITQCPSIHFCGRRIGVDRRLDAWFLRDGREDICTREAEIFEGQFEEYIKE